MTCPRISRLYATARQCDAAERAAYLDQVCADDPDVRREVESLLLDEGVARIGVD